MSFLTLHEVAFGYDKVPVLSSLSLSLKEGRTLALLGPSGSGKTTLLRLIAGFESPARGRVEIRGETVSSTTKVIPPEDRSVGFVFQEFALFPHLTVEQNVAFGLKDSHKQSAAKEALGWVGLEHRAESRPQELSGGEQQRVALARALAPRPGLILFDEPFSHLDPNLRLELRERVRAVLKTEGMTAVLVTHDQAEALSFSDDLGVLFDGRLEQIAGAREVYEQPASERVAQFVGHSNLIRGRVQEGQFVCGLGTLEVMVPTPGGSAGGASVAVVRPEQICIRQETGEVGEAGASFAARVVRVSYEGPFTRVEVECSGPESERLDVCLDSTPQVGDQLEFTVRGSVWTLGSERPYSIDIPRR